MEISLKQEIKPAGAARRTIGWKMILSAFAHGLIALIVFFVIPPPVFAPQNSQQTVSIALVPTANRTMENRKGQDFEPDLSKPAKPPKNQVDAHEKPISPIVKMREPDQRLPMTVIKPVFRFGEKDQGHGRAFDSRANRQRQNKKPADAADGASRTFPSPESEEISRDSPNGHGKALNSLPPAITDHLESISAMADMPRDARAGELCATELILRLHNAGWRYTPEILPSYKLKQGNVLDVRRAGFRAHGKWYDFSFRCNVDERATHVTGFALAIGDPVPRSEWEKRGFPLAQDESL